VAELETLIEAQNSMIEASENASAQDGQTRGGAQRASSSGNGSSALLALARELQDKNAGIPSNDYASSNRVHYS